MKHWKQVLLIALVFVTVLSLLLSACGPVNGSDRGKDKEKGNGNDKDKGQGNDLNDNNRDKDKDKNAKAGKIAICHRTGSEQNPYVSISIANDAVRDGHANHAGDLIPAPEGGCPDTVVVPDVPAK